MSKRGRPRGVYKITFSHQKDPSTTHIVEGLEEAALMVGYSPSYLRVMLSALKGGPITRRYMLADGECTVVLWRVDADTSKP